MSVFGAVILDLVEHLRAQLKGWQIDPLIIHDDNGNIAHTLLVAVHQPQQHESAIQFFCDHLPENADRCLIRCKLPRHGLRMLAVKSINLQYHVSYWLANGWKNDPIAIKNKYGGTYVNVESDGGTLYLLNSIRRVKRTKHGLLYYRDCIEIANPASMAVVVSIICRTLTKSFGRAYGGPSKARLRNYGLAVDLEGKNVVFDPNFSHGAYE